MAHRTFLLGSNQKRVPQLAPDCVIAEARSGIPLLWLPLHQFDERRAIPITLQTKALKHLSQRTEWLAKHYPDPAQLIKCSTELGQMISDSNWKYVTLNFDDLDIPTGGKFGRSFSRALKSFEFPSKRTLSQLAKITADEIFQSAVDDESLIGCSTVLTTKKQKLKTKISKWKDAPTPKGWKAHKKASCIEYTRISQGNSLDEFEASLAKVWLDFVNHVELEPSQWQFIFFVFEPLAGSISVSAAESQPANGQIPKGQRFKFKISSSFLTSEFRTVPEHKGLGFAYSNALTKLGKKVLGAIKSSAKGKEIKVKLKALRVERDRTLCFMVKAKNHFPKITDLKRF